MECWSGGDCVGVGSGGVGVSQSPHLATLRRLKGRRRPGGREGGAQYTICHIPMHFLILITSLFDKLRPSGVGTDLAKCRVACPLVRSARTHQHHQQSTLNLNIICTTFFTLSRSTHPKRKPRKIPATNVARLCTSALTKSMNQLPNPTKRFPP